MLSFPVAVETLGDFHGVASDQVKRIGAALARHQGSDEKVAARQLFERMSITLMRGTAMLMSRRPDYLAPPEVDGIEQLGFHTMSTYAFSPGLFKAKDADPESTLELFEDYLKNMVRRRTC